MYLMPRKFRAEIRTNKNLLMCPLYCSLKEKWKWLGRITSLLRYISYLVSVWNHYVIFINVISRVINMVWHLLRHYFLLCYTLPNLILLLVIDRHEYRFLEIIDSPKSSIPRTKIKRGWLSEKQHCRKTYPSPPVIRIDFLAVGVLILLLSIDPRLSETSVDAMNLTGPACPWSNVWITGFWFGP